MEKDKTALHLVDDLGELEIDLQTLFALWDSIRDPLFDHPFEDPYRAEQIALALEQASPLARAVDHYFARCLNAAADLRQTAEEKLLA